jgi:glycosyltransferase involved in cell wall biosynthesis
MNKKRILFISQKLNATFMKNDLKILQKYYDVIVLDKSKGSKDLNKKVFKLLLRKKVDLIFIWFASYNFAKIIFYSKLFRVPSVVIAGGYDVAGVEDIGYGQFSLDSHVKRKTRFVLKHASILLPVSKFTKNEVFSRIKPKRVDMIYNGVDTKKFKFLKNEKEEIALTVGIVKESNLERKGIKAFVKTAKLLPNVRFVVIGKFADNSIDYLKSIAPSNVEFTGFVTEQDLIKWFQRAKVYVQLSKHEAFGISVAEAMLCGCIPVVCNCGALPEVVGNCGYKIPYGDIENTANAIKKALNLSSEKSIEARDRIKSEFSLKKREDLLLTSINNLL